MDTQGIAGQKIIDLRSWGKHFLICFEYVTIRIHFLLFGSYRINDQKETKPMLSVQFGDAELNLKACLGTVYRGIYIGFMTGSGLPEKLLEEMSAEARIYTFDFLSRRKNRC